MNHNSIKQILLIVCIISLFIVLAFQLQSFVNGLLGALALHIYLRKYHQHLTQEKKWKSNNAALFLIFISIIIFLIPFLYITIKILGSINILLNNYETILLTIHQYLERLETQTGLDFLNAQSIKDLTRKAAVYIPAIFSSTAGIIAQLAIMYFTLFFTLSEKERFETWIRGHLPFNKINNLYLLETLEKSTLSNMASIPIIGVAQGILSLIAYLIIGIDNPFSWALMTGIISVIPIVGTALIWLPIAIYFLIQGMFWQGFFLLAYGTVVITHIDNVIRMTLLKKNSNTHPLITIFGVIIGLNLIGFMGIIFGPILLNYFFILMDIYKKEYF